MLGQTSCCRPNEGGRGWIIAAVKEKLGDVVSCFRTSLRSCRASLVFHSTDASLVKVRDGASLGCRSTYVNIAYVEASNMEFLQLELEIMPHMRPIQLRCFSELGKYFVAELAHARRVKPRSESHAFPLASNLVPTNVRMGRKPAHRPNRKGVGTLSVGEGDAFGGAAGGVSKLTNAS